MSGRFREAMTRMYKLPERERAVLERERAAGFITNIEAASLPGVKQAAEKTGFAILVKGATNIHGDPMPDLLAIWATDPAADQLAFRDELMADNLV